MAVPEPVERLKCSGTCGNDWSGSFVLIEGESNKRKRRAKCLRTIFLASSTILERDMSHTLLPFYNTRRLYKNTMKGV
jgi:hypothetical protein